MTITGKTAGRPQPAPSMEPAGTKSAKDSISVLKKQPETTNDADNTCGSAPSQRTTVTRPSTSETRKEWSDDEEDSEVAFAKSCKIARTPTQTCCTPPDVAMAPKKKESKLTMQLRGSNVTSTSLPCTQSNEVSIAPPSDDVIDALKKALTILGQTTVRKGEKEVLQQIIGLAINEITAMKEELKECRKQLEKPSPADDSTRLSNIESHLAEITKALTESPRTYAQAVQRNTANARNVTGSHPPQSAPGIKERAEKLKRERANTEVVLTIRDATDDVKDKLTNMSEEALTDSLQQAIASAGIEGVKIRRAQKMPNHGIKIRCSTDEEAKELRGMDWKRDFEGVSVVETVYRVVYHGVSKFDIDFEKDKPEEIIARIRDSNSEELTIKGVEPLLKRPRNPNAPTQSIVISFKCLKQADNCMEMGINIERRHYQIA